MVNRNKYEIILKNGNGSYVKDPLKLEFVYNNKIYTVNELFDKIFCLEDEIAKKDQQFEIKFANQAKVNQLLVEAVEQLQKKVARLESKDGGK